MVPYLDTTHVEQRVRALWKEYGLEPRFDIERLIDHLELGLLWTPLERNTGLVVAGALVPDHRKILVNEDLLPSFEANPPLLRFTLAHEVAHWHLHARLITQGVISDSRAADGALACRSLDLDSPRGHRGDAYRLEFQASLFASHLLMPDALLAEHLEHFGCNGWRAVSAIARAVGMSPTAVSVRLVQDGHAHKDEAGVPRPGRADAPQQATLNL